MFSPKGAIAAVFTPDFPSMGRSSTELLCALGRCRRSRKKLELAWLRVRPELCCGTATCSRPNRFNTFSCALFRYDPTVIPQARSCEAGAGGRHSGGWQRLAQFALKLLQFFHI